MGHLLLIKVLSMNAWLIWKYSAVLLICRALYKSCQISLLMHWLNWVLYLIWIINWNICNFLRFLIWLKPIVKIVSELLELVYFYFSLLLAYFILSFLRQIRKLWYILQSNILLLLTFIFMCIEVFQTTL